MSVESPPQALERRLGPLDAAAIVISNVVGVGIFITPRIIAQAAPHPIAFLGVWFAGGLLAFIGAMAYAELGTLRPRSGGEYVYLREGFGGLAAFLTGWTSFVAGFAGAIAAGALGVSDYLGRFIPAAGDATPIFTVPLPLVPPLVLSPRTLVALTAIYGLAFVHIRGLGPGRVVQNSLAVVKVSSLALFVALGLAIGRGSMAHLTAPVASASFNLPLAFIVVMFAYSGWNAASYVAEEIRDPGRNVPIALALGTGAVVLLYLGLNVVYLYAVPIHEIANGAQSEIAMVAADALLGPVASRLLGALAVVVLIGSLSAMTVAGPRVYFAMARDRAFFSAAARVHPRFHTPWVAIAAQAVWSSLLVLTNTKDQLAEYTGFAVLLFSAFAVSSVFILRRRYPDEPRAFKAWGYPVAPALFVIASLAITGAAVAGRPGPSLWGAGIIAAGIPLYLVFRSRQSRATVHDGQNPQSR
ncbi:MAG: APC family permease [Bacteroidales bacterium]